MERGLRERRRARTASEERRPREAGPTGPGCCARPPDGTRHPRRTTPYRAVSAHAQRPAPYASASSFEGARGVSALPDCPPSPCSFSSLLAPYPDGPYACRVGRAVGTDEKHVERAAGAPGRRRRCTRRRGLPPPVAGRPTRPGSAPRGRRRRARRWRAGARGRRCGVGVHPGRTVAVGPRERVAAAQAMRVVGQHVPRNAQRTATRRTASPRAAAGVTSTRSPTAALCCDRLVARSSRPSMRTRRYGSGRTRRTLPSLTGVGRSGGHARARVRIGDLVPCLGAAGSGGPGRVAAGRGR